MESTFLRKLSPQSGAAVGESEGGGGDAAAVYPNGGGSNRARGCPPVSGASTGPFVPCGLLRLPTRPLGDRCRAHSASALLAIQLGARPRHQGVLRHDST